MRTAPPPVAPASSRPQRRDEQGGCHRRRRRPAPRRGPHAHRRAVRTPAARQAWAPSSTFALAFFNLPLSPAASSTVTSTPLCSTGSLGSCSSARMTSRPSLVCPTSRCSGVAHCPLPPWRSGSRSPCPLCAPRSGAGPPHPVRLDCRAAGVPGGGDGAVRGSVFWALRAGLAIEPTLHSPPSRPCSIRMRGRGTTAEGASWSIDAKLRELGAWAQPDQPPTHVGLQA